MPKLSNTEFKLFEQWARSALPFSGFFQIPRNRTDITQDPLYKRFVEERPFARLSPRAAEILSEAGIAQEPGTVVGRATPGQRAAAGTARIEAAGVDLTAPTGVQGAGIGDIEPGQDFPSPGAAMTEVLKLREQFPGMDFGITRDQDTGRFSITSSRKPAVDPNVQAQIEASQQQPFDFQEQRRLEQQQRQFNVGQQQQEFQFSQGIAQQDAQRAFQEQQLQQSQSQFQANLAFQQQQAQQEAQLREQQERARLAANPINWLQFAAFTGQEPVIQPWMVPLGFQQFGQGITPQGGTAQPQVTGTGAQGFSRGGFQTGQQAVPAGQVNAQVQQPQVGQVLPGFSGFNDFSSLQALTRPSAQFLSRSGPTATSQFLGFERARTGSSPEETLFRQRAAAPPSGRFSGFTGFR